MSRIEDTARAYFERVRAADAAGVAGMFATDGAYASPSGERICGPAAIETYYRAVFAGAAPQPEVQALATDGDLCFAEIVARRSDGSSVRVVDLFTCDRDGKIVEMAVYVGPTTGAADLSPVPG